jgi:hypothetical protein
MAANPHTTTGLPPSGSLKGDLYMETREKLADALDVISSIIERGRYPVGLLRAHRLLESAIGDFFSDPSDVAVPFPADDVISELADCEPPF